MPGAAEVELHTLPGSPLPAEITKLGYEVTQIGETERILPGVIVEKFTRRTDGELEPLTEGSTRRVALTVSHAGIVRVERHSFEVP